jgi:thymidylate synthase ThyX
MKTIEGKSSIKATVICDSISPDGVRLVTWELEYPRIIHAELMTHRMFSRNAASSRAIPAAKMMQQLTAKPVRFGANVSGMQDNGEHDGLISGRTNYIRLRSGDEHAFTDHLFADAAWEAAKEDAIFWSKAFADAGYHKQVFNRLTEPFQMMKTIVSATEFANFFWLRNDGAADPTLQELARCMLEALNSSTSDNLKAGHWHLPYVDTCRQTTVSKYYLDFDSTEEISLEDAIKVSCARCAAVSYRNEDYGLEKCKELYDRLVGADRKHASALEHCATPMLGIEHLERLGNVGKCHNMLSNPVTWQKGISHVDRDGNLWSGNFKGWIQYRKTIEGENYVKN